MDSTLYHRLSPINRRVQLRKLFMTLATIWLLATAAGMTFWWLKAAGVWYSFWTLPSLLLVAFVATLWGFWFALREDEDFRATATRIEHRFPELDSSLITAIEQKPRVPHGTLGFLQHETVRRAIYHGYQHSWARIVPQWHLLVVPLLGCLVLLAFLVVLIGQFMEPAPYSSGAGGSDDPASMLAGEVATGLIIEPGNVTVERYSSLMVLARFGSRNLPHNAELVFWNDQRVETRLSMNKSLDDPVFGTRIASVKEPLEYAVRFDGQQSDKYRVDVFEFPRLERADARLQFPEYTGEPEKLVQDTRRVSAVSGTHLTLMLQLNKPIAEGRLIGKDGAEFDLQPDPVEPNRYLVSMNLLESMRLTLELKDAEGRENKAPPVFSLRALGNQPCEIQQLAPASDVEVSPLEELSLSVNFRDDFGVTRAGINYGVTGEEPDELELASNLEATTQHQIDHVLAFEDLQVEPDQLLTFYFWAEDQGPDGEVRRTLGDIHFVTVREFEEIFRQGDQQPGGAGGGQGGGGGGSQDAELQKQIVYAIWNLARRPFFDSAGDKFAEDVKIISQSQTEAMQQLDQQAEMLGNPQVVPLIQEAKKFQQATVDQLERIAIDKDPNGLQDAQISAQQAYQVLLKLRPDETRVSRNNRQGGGGGGQSRAQQQMEELQLDSDENRYETEQLAGQNQETTEDRENRQVLSRLRELARRQNDLNQRIQELQSALEQAESDQEREEIEKQLKRLREEQQQILRDTEELQDRMERPENRSRMSEQAQQLEDVRDNVQQSSQALDEGDTSRAAAKGARAVRDLEELRDEFQNRTSGRFDQQMREMRNEARDIEQEQNEIAESMEQMGQQSGEQAPSLSESGPAEGLEQRLQEQRERVEDLRQEMRDTIEEAESFEPILAERLYDTYRRSQQESPEQALDSTSQSLERGFVNDAKREQRRASRSIERLREGIDEAAEAVLGDETEALRRANRELQRLTNEVEGEQTRANPDQDEDESTDQAAAGQGDQPREDPGGQGSQSESEQTDQTEPGQGQGQRNDEQTAQQPGQGQQGDPSQQPNGQQGSEGPPSLTGNDRRQQGQRGALGADPEINYDEETWSDPFTGEDYVDWSDRLRDVEEMVADPELRAEAARIRDQARSIRREIKRHSQPPNWELIELKVIQPLVELQDRVHEELVRRGGKDMRVPIDRDPVPAEYESAVRKYFEQLGRGE